MSSLNLRPYCLLAALMMVCGFAVPQSVHATAEPPRSDSVYGMDILGASWQWVFPREDAWPRMSGRIRLDLLDSAFRQVAEAGVRWNRMAIWWCMVEPERGQYFWDDVDAAIQIGRNYGIETVPVLFFTPYWAVAGAPAGQECINNTMKNYPPTDMADWDNYVRTIVRRYGTQGSSPIRYWEIWNEPDLWEFLVTNPPGGNTSGVYAQLLNRAARIIDAESPGASVILGGLSDINGQAYLDTLLSLRGSLDVRGNLDIVAFHSYGAYTSRIDRLRASMAAHGISQKPLWNTEVNNWGTDFPAVVAALPGIYREFADGGVTRSFWYTSCTSSFGLGIFHKRTPEWDPLPFVQTPLFVAFRNQAVPYRLSGVPTLLAPGAITHKPVLVFTWEASTPGVYPIVGYKLQIDNTLFRNSPLFVKPELDVWVSLSDRTSYLPLVMGRRSVVGATAGSPARTHSLVTYTPFMPLAWGPHYWRVAAVDSRGNVGPYSAPRSLQVRMPFDTYLPLTLQ